MSPITRIFGWGIAAGLLCPAGLAMGAAVDITIGGVSHQLVAGDLPGMFGEPRDFITAEDLAGLNDTLVDAGVETVGHVSLLLAETARGLSLITLFDGMDGSAPGTPPTSLLGAQLIWQGEDTSLANLGRRRLMDGLARRGRPDRCWCLSVATRPEFRSPRVDIADQHAIGRDAVVRSGHVQHG